jgi:octaprenyl-diphosphate synthase
MLAAETSAVTIPSAAPAPKLSSDWKHIIERVEPFLHAVERRLAEQVQEFQPEIAAYAEYAMSVQGKQLRPTLVALSADATGELNDDHVTVAVIIEMVHLATLVHDDIMDEAAIRRGRPTLAANWGNEISVLLGDCLFAHALKLAASFPTPEICRAVASATNTVCSGEILQTQRRRDFNISRKDYFKILAMKTAELFALSCEIGAFLAHASPASREALRQYGVALGTAYQVYDDCLDLFGSELAVGKSLGTDLAKGKMTLPLLILLEKSEGEERKRLLQQMNSWDPACLPELLRLLEGHDALSEARANIHQFLESARKTLIGLRPSEAGAALLGLTEYIAHQTDALGEVA